MRAYFEAHSLQLHITLPVLTPSYPSHLEPFSLKYIHPHTAPSLHATTMPSAVRTSSAITTRPCRAARRTCHSSSPTFSPSMRWRRSRAHRNTCPAGSATASCITSAPRPPTGSKPTSHLSRCRPTTPHRCPSRSWRTRVQVHSDARNDETHYCFRTPQSGRNLTLSSTRRSAIRFSSRSPRSPTSCSAPGAWLEMWPSPISTGREKHDLHCRRCVRVGCARGSMFITNLL